MSIRRMSLYLSLAFLAVLLIGLPIRSQFTETQQTEDTVLVPGRNVNMVSGITLPGGDPWLQRQNEPSMAVSTRNPLHLLAGANDYRTVDMAASEGNLPGKAQGAMAGDAWVGVYKSFDGGESWTTSLIPGFPQDNSTVGAGSPLKAFSTAADPIVRAGTNGLFYYSGMAFNRAQEKGGGSIFLTRFIDNNNVEGGDPIKYLDTKVIDLGTSGQFIDMPRIGVDMPRGTGTVTIDGQSIPKSNIYCAYTVFLGNTSTNIRSRIMFRRSTDCGATWGSAIKLSESQHIIQGATIAIDPTSGAVYVAFRRFLHPSQTNAIVIAKSIDFGQTFGQPTVIAEINPFDQPATDAAGDDISDPMGPSFRTNSYPTMAVDENAVVYVAWTERGRGPTGEARIVMSTSQAGTGWTQPTEVINVADQNFQGHQFMPSLSFAQGKLVLVWYDQRYDEYAPLYGVGTWIGDNMPIRHTTDVRCAQAEPGLAPVFQPSVQISKYLWALTPGSDTLVEQVQYSPPNFEMFKGGTTPFHGDYIEVTPSPQFVKGENGWKFNTDPTNTPIFHAVWTDNRDVRPPTDGNWANYTPPASDQGVFGEKTCGSVTLGAQGMRNQNIYTSSLIQGVAVASPGNSKELGDELGDYYQTDDQIPRAFVIYVKNPGYEIKTFRLSIEPEPTDVDASFVEFEDLEELDVMIAPYSTIARTVFVRSPDVDASVRVNVVEIDGLGGSPVPGGLTGSVVLNPDPTTPIDSPVDEFHDPDIPDPNIVNWDELNPNIVNPNIRNYPNPNIRNWDELNPNIVNPNIRNANIVSPNIRNPNIRNPNIVNPNIRNINIPEEYDETAFNGAEIADAVFTIKNEGNTTSTYTLKTYSKESLPDAVYAQLLVYRVHYTPAGDYYQETTSACDLKQERHHELLLNVTNPNIRNPNIRNPNIRNPNIRNGGLENATFCVPPGEEVEAVLRVIDFSPNALGQFRTMQSGSTFSAEEFAKSIGFAATSHAYNTDDARTTPKEQLSYPTSATKLVISTSSLPDGVLNVYYAATLTADGGATPYSWSLTAGELPPPLQLNNSTGEIYGTPTAAGLYNFIVRVDDSEGDFDTQEFSIYVDSDSLPDPITITTTSLPSGVLGYWYGAGLEATGGVWPRTWSLAGGSLPLGLSLDSDGGISGTILQQEGQDYPTTYNFTVMVADNAGHSTSAALSIYVNIATGTYLTISGMVYDEDGDPLDGVVMRGLPNTPITGANGTPGYYEDEVPENWSGTVEPFKAGHAFSPSSRTYSMVGSNQSSQDYNAGPIVPASKLVFTQSPNGGVGGAIWTTQPIVEVQDDDGNTITSDNSTVVILDIDTNPGSGSLSGYISMTVTDGVAMFAGLSIDKGGWGYTLEAASSPLTAATSEPFNVEGFRSRANMSIARADLTATYLFTDKILVAGGSNPNDGYLNTAELYNPAANDFEVLSMNNPRGEHTATPLLDGRVLITGGGGGTTAAELFDPASKTFSSTTGTMNHARIDHRATRLQDGRVLITGGNSPYGDTAELYDPTLGTFSPTGSMNENRYYHTSTWLPNGKVLITGGRPYGGGAASATAELYDPSTGTFSPIASMNSARNRHVATLLNDGTVLITGGDDGALSLNGAEIFNSADNSFTQISSMNYFHTGHQALLLRDSTVLVFGNGQAEIYDPATLSFRLTGRFAEGPGDGQRQDCAAAETADGRIFVCGGGYAFGEVVATTEMWNPLNPFPTHVISGHVMASAVGVPGVLLAGLPGFPITDQGGYYEGVVLDGWDGTITPTKPGYTFSPTFRTYEDVTSDVSTQDYNTIVGPPAKLAFSQQPTNTAVGATITPAVTVEIQDADGNLVTTATDDVTLSFTVNPGGAILGGTTIRAAVGGIATFDNLSIDTAGTGYQLRANSDSLADVDSSPFDILAGAATKILVETAPDGLGTVVPDQEITPGFTITVYAVARDAGGNFVENIAADSWSLINKSGGVVDSDLVSGSLDAQFTGHAVGSAQIHAEKAGLVSVDSGWIYVIAGAPGKIDLTGPAKVGAGFISEAFTVTSQDAGGNPVNVPQNTTFNLSSNTLGTKVFYSNPEGITPITQVTILSGQSSVVFYYMDDTGGTPNVTATWASGGSDLASSAHPIATWIVTHQIVFRSSRDGNNEIYGMNADTSGLIRLTQNEASDLDASWSRSGSKIAFVSDRDGNNEIYVMNADGSWVTRLTDNSADDRSPSWSPEGNKIAFTTNRDGNYEVYVMNADGTTPVNLSGNSAIDGHPSWSPDGSKLVFNSYRTGKYEVFIMNADGSGQVQLTNTPGTLNTAPFWSPDGSKILFTSDRDGNSEVYIMNADGTGQINLSGNASIDQALGWSPDGSKILFHSWRDGNAKIYVMNADGTGQAILSNNLSDYEADWGGSKIAFQRSNEIFIMNSDGSGQTRLTNNSANDGSPSWSPDGDRIAFYSDLGGGVADFEIYVIRADGSGLTKLTNNPSAPDSAPCWSPDGSKIVWSSYQTYYGSSEICVMNADGTGQTNLTKNTDGDFVPCWSPDGSKIAFASTRDDLDYEIYIMNSDGSGQTRLTVSPGRDLNPCWSPDGSKIAFNSERDGNYEVYIMNADGTSPTNMTSNTAEDQNPHYSPDGKKTVFYSNRNGNYEIYVMNTDGTNVTRLTYMTGWDTNPSWRPKPRLLHIYEFVTKWGTSGTGNGQFDWPKGVAVDNAGYILVSDTRNARIQKFTSTGDFQGIFGESIVAYPEGIAIGPDGSIYIVDATSDSVHKFTSAGTFVKSWGGEGSGDGQLNQPEGIAVDSYGNVYVADFLNYRVQKFDSNGGFLLKWGSAGTGDGEFAYAYGIAVDSFGNVYVADSENNRIQKFTSTGAFLAKWGTAGSGDGQFYDPFGIVVDSAGLVYVADTHNQRMQKFTSDGTFLTKWGTAGSGDGQFNMPYKLAVDNLGNVYVADTLNNRIQKFRRK